MKAICQTAKEHGAVSFDEVGEPSVGDDEALVRVHSAGLCGSDAHAYKFASGYKWIDVPRVMGHEYAGRVVAIGDDVESVEVGDNVVERPIHECGHCYQCENDEYHVCQNFEITGFHYDGAYREYTTVPVNYLLRIPDSIPLEHAAITEPMSIATRAVIDNAEFGPGATVLVEGPGPIGMLCAVIADAIGADVTVSGLSSDAEFRLPLAAEQELSTINIENSDLAEYTDANTDGGGFDVIFDTTGHHTGIEMAVDNVRRGGQVVPVGLPEEDSEFFLTPLVRGEVQIDCSYGAKRRNFQQALRLMDQSVVDPAGLIDDSYAISDPETAFEDFLSGEALKPVFRFWDESADGEHPV